jgi:hypothetical protein
VEGVATEPPVAAAFTPAAESEEEEGPAPVVYDIAPKTRSTWPAHQGAYCEAYAVSHGSTFQESHQGAYCEADAVSHGSSDRKPDQGTHTGTDEGAYIIPNARTFGPADTSYTFTNERAHCSTDA